MPIRTYSLEESGQRSPSTLVAPSTGDGGSLAAGQRTQTLYPFPLDAGLRPCKVVIGCFCLSIAIYGLLSSIGLFSTYWHKHQLSDYTESEIS